MADATTVRVRGRALRRVRPDRASVTFTIEAAAHTVASAGAELGKRWGRLEAVLGEHAGSIVRREASWLTVDPRLWRDAQTGEERRDGFVARRRITVVVADPGDLGPLLHEVAAAVPDVALHGPEWEVDEANEVHDEVRAAAAADARRRADAYARGLGATVSGVVSIVEPELAGVLPGADGRLSRAMAFADGGALDGAATHVLEVSDEEVEVEASVVVELRLA